MKKKLVVISSLASPHIVKFCYALQEYYEAEFWFYDLLGTRPSWWKIELGEKCKIIEGTIFKKSGRYLTLSHLRELKRFNPDIVMLGGFSIPANYIAYLWARLHNKKTIVSLERSRDKNGVLRKKTIIWVILKYLYRNIDLVMVNSNDTVEQYKDTFGFGNKVIESQYACDLEKYYSHEERLEKTNYTLLFANRLTEIYNPLLAIEIFNELLKKYPDIKMRMNSSGELKHNCVKRIEELNLNDKIEFLTEINSWNEMHIVYKESDILLLPANFSNGNFTILEAMASGMGIVISNKVLGLGKLIEHNVNGFNCEPNKMEFVNAIEQYLQCPDLFIKHSAINRPLTKQFSEEGTAERYFKSINKLYE